MVQRATDVYRGDGTGSFVTMTIHYFTLSTGEEVRIEEAYFTSDPFPRRELTLRDTRHKCDTASNPGDAADREQACDLCLECLPSRAYAAWHARRARGS